MRPAIQAAGHTGAQQGNGIFVKPSSSAEIAFYQTLIDADSPLLAVVPQYMGMLTSGTAPQAAAATIDANDTNSQSEGPAHGQEPTIVLNADNVPAGSAAADPDGQPLIVLEDELASYRSPSVIDVKLGTLLWDHDTPDEKRLRLQKVRDTTTSGSLGFRIAGMSVVQLDGERKAYDKQFGRNATKDTIVASLKHFFPDTAGPFRTVLLGIIEHLREVREILEENPIEVHSGSVMIVYESDREFLQEKLDKGFAEYDDMPEDEDNDEVESDIDDDDMETPQNGTWTIKLIDFAHARLVEKPFEDVLWGLDNLVSTFQALADLEPTKQQT